MGDVIKSKLSFLTDRYNESILKKYKNKIEINVRKNGTIFINGMGNFDELEKKLKLIDWISYKKICKSKAKKFLMMIL